MNILSALCCFPSSKPDSATESLNHETGSDRAENSSVSYGTIQIKEDYPSKFRIRRLSSGAKSSMTISSRSSGTRSRSFRSSRKNTNESNRRTSGNGGPTPKEKVRQLHLKLENAMERDPDSLNRFVPISFMKEWVQDDLIRDVLQFYGGETDADISELTNFVRGDATRIFAILVWWHKVQLIEEFFVNEITDCMLPVNEDLTYFDLKPKSSITIKDIFRDTDLEAPDIDAFCNTHQWPFLSPVFHANQFKYAFHANCNMPYLNIKNTATSNFSIVQKASIHKDHVEMGNFLHISRNAQGHPYVAVKELIHVEPSDNTFKDAAEEEADALALMRGLDHPHLIKAIAYYTQRKKHYFVFPWASGGSLRDLWKRGPPKELDRGYLEWMFSQLRGLASAINVLHDKTDCRHGDLKPENILCFDETLVITDVGLAKVHQVATFMRKDPTRTMSGTVMYEPPETDLAPNVPRSRRYDIWSIGCIYLEFIIWLIYGVDELGRFRQELDKSRGKFYDINYGGTKAGEVNVDVKKWIDWIKKDPRCPEETALHQLVSLISSRLLVVEVGVEVGDGGRDRVSTLKRQSTIQAASESVMALKIVRTGTGSSMSSVNQPHSEYRASAEEMYESLNEIWDNATGSRPKIEWMNWKGRKPQGPKHYGTHLGPSQAGFKPPQNLSPLTIQDSQTPAYSLHSSELFPLDDKWEYTPDTEIALGLFTDLRVSAVLPPKHEGSSLCIRCSDLPIWTPNCYFSDTLQNLAESASDCPLCRLIYKKLGSKGIRDGGEIKFWRAGSYLTAQDRWSKPIVSIYTMSTVDPRPYHTEFNLVGLPILPGAGSTEHVNVLTQWIRNCDHEHICAAQSSGFFPTRVIDVGTNNCETIRLVSSLGAGKEQPYLALSHRWGLPEQHRRFCTYKANVKAFMNHISINELPKTFQDAVEVTRSLGVQYLWIDSLCIIQDDTQDWDKESRLMEYVYSSAYVTIAASCASGTNDGFLKPRLPRECITMEAIDGNCYYLCDAIDDFSLDVELGELNKRGWILQERALSRRTIYFTEKQTYWECGGGVRCETLTKMNNQKASFLGDADFPRSVEAYVKGKKIQLYQDLYKKYSKLALSSSADRPVAIKGLEARLMRSFGTTGGYGVFDCFLHRCLLWRRAGEFLKRIQSFRRSGVPSWSWMAYDGGIEYLDIPFGVVSWDKDLTSPFKASTPVEEGTVLPRIAARVLTMGNCDPKRLSFDEPDRTFSKRLKCVIVGRQKLNDQDEDIHYVLIVYPKSQSENTEVYERVGVGSLPTGCIQFSESSTEVLIE